MPAQLTSPISLPSDTAFATTAWPSSSLDTSHLTNAPPMSPATCSPAFGLHVGDDDLAAFASQHSRRAFTEARSAAGDDENLACDVHGAPRCLQASAVHADIPMKGCSQSSPLSSLGERVKRSRA